MKSINDLTEIFIRIIIPYIIVIRSGMPKRKITSASAKYIWDGIRMPHLNKINSKDRLEENSIDFHLEIINKIDKLLKENKDRSLSSDEINEEQLFDVSKDFPVEIRSPLSKKIISPETKLEEKPDNIFNKGEGSPEEFKKDISEDIHELKEEENAHIEIIDLGNKSIVDLNFPTKSNVLQNKIRKIKQNIYKNSRRKQDSKNIENIKVEVIETTELENKKHNKVFSKDIFKTNEKEKRKKIFYLNSNNEKNENKLIESNSEQIYKPVNFGKDLKKRIEKERKESEQIKEKDLKKKKKESEKLKKLEAKKTKLEEREREKSARKAEKEREIKQKIQEKKEKAAPINREILSPADAPSDTKKTNEWKSYNAKVEIPGNNPEINKNVQKEKFNEIDQKNLRREKEKERKIAEKEKINEIKRQEKEKRIIEKEDKRTKKIEAKKAKLEAKEKVKIVNNAEKERKKNLIMEQKKKRAKEREADKLNKMAIIKQKTPKQKGKKSFNLFKKEKSKEEKNKLQFETNNISLNDEKKTVETKDENKKEEHQETKEKSEPSFLDEDIKKLLLITDDLLGKLPEEVIENFSQSEDFKLYSKIFNKYKLK